MKLAEVRDILEAEVIWGEEYIDKEIKTACASDLLSDVLAFIKSGSLLLTGLKNIQTVRTADMVDIVAICFVRGKRPDDETLALAKEKGIPLLSTRYLMYESSGRLFKNGLSGCFK
jgi:predicted transcriptional regulator